MLRSDLRETVPAAVPIIQSLLKGDVNFTNFEAAIAEKGVEVGKLDISLELPSNEAVRLAVREGAGVSALSELVAEAGIRFGALAPVKFPLPERAFHALRHRERYLSKSGAAFLESVQI